MSLEVKEAEDIRRLVDGAEKILVMQADNPDGDSLGSALALEQVIHELGKEPILYCGVDMPSRLRFLSGWDRVSPDIPNDFDLSIIVDASTRSLFGKLTNSDQIHWVESRPAIVIDHHDVEPTIDYATVICNYPTVAAAELVYELALNLNWPLNLSAKEAILAGIMSDSLGLTSEATTARSVEIIAELVRGGVNIAELENRRRDLMVKSPELVRYKGELLQRIEYFDDDQIAIIHIPWEEIEKYSNEYNPSVLVIDDMRLTKNTKVAIAFKTYDDGHITAKIRTNYGWSIAGDLAEKFGGGGHRYASGFKITDGRDYESIKQQTIIAAQELLANIKMGNTNEAI